MDTPVCRRTYANRTYACLAKDVPFSVIFSFCPDILPLYFALRRHRSRGEEAYPMSTGGMDALGETARQEYVSDFKDFVTYVRDKGVQTYAG